MKNILKIIVGLSVVIYAFGTFIFGAYWNYLFAVKHGFISWLLLGEIIPSLQSIVWPIILFLNGGDIHLGT